MAETCHEWCSRCNANTVAITHKFPGGYDVKCIDCGYVVATEYDADPDYYDDDPDLD